MQVLLHVPHTSLKVPKYFYRGLIISKEEFRKYNLEMTDCCVDYLFKDAPYRKIKAKYSRLFVDVERFKNEEKEVMNQYGEGVIYTHLYDGKMFHQHNEKYRQKALKYYDRYHKKLDKTVQKMLKKDDELLILDCHSFSNKMAKHFFAEPFCDICIGIEKEYYDEKIVNKIISEIEKKGYSWKINDPYQGSIVPNIILKNKVKGRVISIMIEINKRIYL